MFKNLSTSTKLLILCGMFVIPIASTTYGLVAEKRIAINFARKELAGSRYLAVVRDVYASVLARQANDPELLKSTRAPQELLSALAAAEANASGVLQTAALSKQLAASLQQLLAAPPGSDEHASLLEVLAAARNLASRIGDDSNLVLDTDLDSYHVQTVVVGKLPGYAGALAEMQALLRADTRSGAFVGTHATQLMISDSLLRASADQLREELAAAYRGNADGTLKPALQSEMEGILSKVGSYLSAVSTSLFAGQALDLRPIDQAFAGAADSLRRGWLAAQQQLDRLLEQRIAKLINKLRRSLMLISALGGLSIVVALMTHRHIVRPLEQLESVARNVRESKDYSLRVDKTSSDEIGRLATAFNDMLAELAAARAREMADHTRSAQRALDLLVSVRSAASAADSISGLAADCLRQICQSREWQLGQVWYPDEREGLLRCADEPVYGEAKYREFHALSLQTPLQKGQGLPGRTWANKSPVWISQTVDNPQNLPRLKAARAMGFRASFAFPVMFADQVLAVFEFLSDHTRAPDPTFLDAVEKLGRFLGDILVRQRSEAALKASESRWQLVFENSTFGISLLDENFRFIAANPAYESMLGYTSEELRNLTPLDISVAVESETNLRLFRELHDGKRQHYDIVKRLRRKDGSVIWVQIHTFAIPQMASEPRIFFSTVIDVTASKTAQDVLRATQAELAHMSRLTTMGEMAASIAHEINQPLAAIVANANSGLRWLGNKTPNLDEARAALKRIVNDGHRASDVIGSIRASLKGGRQQKVLLDLNELIGEVLALMAGELERHGITVRTELGPIAPVLADRVQFQQVILNLLTNASEAMSGITEGPRILHIQSALGETRRVLITIADTGVGIDPKDVEHIFDRFYTTKPQGMGMGLSICRSIVESHQGQLWAEPGSPQGSVFRMLLPTAETDAPAGG